MKIKTKIEGSEEVHYIDLHVEANVILRVTQNDIEQVSMIPADANDGIWDSAISSKLQNLRWKFFCLGINPVCLLFVISELKATYDPM